MQGGRPLYQIVIIMLDYLQKFNALPKDLRSKISGPAIMSTIESLEEIYKINLAAVIMKIMVKELALSNLDQYFVKINNLKSDQAKELVQILEEKVFSGVRDYLMVNNKESVPPTEEDSAVVGSSFFFSSEDEEEIRKLSNKINKELKPDSSGGELDDTLNKIIIQAKINFGSEHLLNRFKEILKTYLRGVRNKIDTRQTLMKPFAGGGLGFDSDSTDKLLVIIDETKTSGQVKPRPPLKIKLPEDQARQIGNDKDKTPSSLRDADYDLATALKKNSVRTKAKPGTKKIDVTHELAPPPPAIRQPIKPKVSFSQVPIKSSQVAKQSAIKKVNTPKVKRPDSMVNGRQRMEDVKHVPKVMNPIDELRYLDLISFHRLAPDPIGQVAKIKTKLQLLEEEQYSKRIEGIKAWRQSPINRLYLTIGQESINQNRPINDIIEVRKKSNQDYLTSEEFKTIMDLNKELRF